MAAPNQTKESRTIIPGTWGDTLRTYDSLPAGRVLTTTLNQVEIAILEGDFFRTFSVVSVAAGAKAYFEFTAPPNTVAFGLVQRDIIPTYAGVWYRAYAGATGIVTTGSASTVFNENGYSPKTSQTQIKNVTSFTTLGTLTDVAYIPLGQGNQTKGSLDRREGFKIIPANTKLLLEVENLYNATNEILLYFQWIEAPAQITGTA